MKKLFTSLGTALVCCVGALAIPVTASADEVKERASFTYGDAMGTASTDVWTNYVHNFYDKDGKVVRTATLFRANTGDINLSKKTEWTYNEAGQPTESLQYTAKATSQDNVDKEYAFDLTGKTVWEYNEQGLLSSTYTMQYRASTGAWVANKNSCYEYTYDANGVLTSAKYWLSQTTANASNPTQNITYEYDNNGRLSVEKHVGAYYSSTYDREYSYDAQGRCIHAINTCTLESSAANYNKTLLEETWSYEGDVLKYYQTDSYYNTTSASTVTTKRTVYETVGSNPLDYYEYSETYKSATDEWSRSANFSGKLNQDYAELAQLVPELSVTTSSAASVNISFTLPAISYDNYAVRIYRDGAELKTLTKDELEGIKNGDTYSFTDESNLTNGDHEYFAQVLVADANQTISADSELAQGQTGYKEGFISNIATAQVVIPYPEITDFHIKGYTLTRTWVPEQVDEEDPELTVPAYWREDYKLYFEWTPLTEEQVEGYNFERYDIMFKGAAGSASMMSISDISTGSASIDWFDRYTEAWLEIKYGEDHIATQHITINLDQLTNLTPTEPLPVYGVEYYLGYTPAFVKADLSKPEETAEVLYNLWDDSNTDMYSIFGGVTVGDSYYALYEDEYGDYYLGAFDMTNKKYVQIGDAYTEESFSDLLYDEASDELYAVAPAGNASYLYTIDRTSGAASKTSIALPSYTLYLASAGDGQAYAMAAETGKFQLYSVDLGTGTYSKIEGVTVDGTQNTWSSLLYYDDALYFNLGTSLYTINPTDKSVLTNTALNRALSGVTTKLSTALPETTAAGGKDSHIITTERSSDGTTNYYYSYWNQLERVAEFDAEGNLTRYTKNTVDDALRLVSTEIYEPSVDEYGLPTTQVTATSTYTYNDEGLLAEKSNSDGTWVRYQYNDGIVAEETYGNGETTERTVEYQYMQYPDKPTYVFTRTGSDEAPSDVAMFQYDESGNKIVEAHTADMMSGMYSSFETWEYFPGTGIVSVHNICAPNEFTETGDPVVASSTKYRAIGDNYNHLMSQDFDGNDNPIEGTAKDLVYSDLTNTAELAYLTATATAVEESANNVAVGFTIPQLAETSGFSLDFFRDGVQVGQLSADEIAEMNLTYMFTDTQVPNGNHEYFVRTNRIGTDGETTALQISEILDITLDKELPTVSDIAYVKYETVDDNGDPIENPAEGEGNYIVTIGWTNPEVPEEYGFTGNHLFLVDGEQPVGAGVFTDLQTAEAAVNAGKATSFKVMMQSRYALGAADSEIKLISFEPQGLGGIVEDGLNIRIENKKAIASEEAVISVFSIDGVRIASTYGVSLDLSALNGTYIVTAEKDKAVRIVKVIL